MRPAPLDVQNSQLDKERREREKIMQEEQLIVALWLNINKFM
jgi:hypothetical protein